MEPVLRPGDDGEWRGEARHLVTREALFFLYPDGLIPALERLRRRAEDD